MLFRHTGWRAWTSVAYDRKNVQATTYVTNQACWVHSTHSGPKSKGFQVGYLWWLFITDLVINSFACFMSQNYSCLEPGVNFTLPFSFLKSWCHTTLLEPFVLISLIPVRVCFEFSYLYKVTCSWKESWQKSRMWTETLKLFLSQHHPLFLSLICFLVCLCAYLFVCSFCFLFICFLVEYSIPVNNFGTECTG